ncbi:MAG: oxidoreductase, partial [Candidatus Saccharimonadales bacterium]
MKLLDSLLDQITMYKLLVYYLLALIGAAMLLSALGILSYNPIAILVLSAYAVTLCWIANKLFAYLFKVPANPESPVITGLILALIITPLLIQSNFLFIAAASGLAMASKYLITIGNKHLFNPVAIAVLATSLGAGQAASWWIGSAALAPFVLIGGLLLVRKIRRGAMVACFFWALII